MIRSIKKRDGNVVSFDLEKIANAIYKAASAVGGKDKATALSLARIVVSELDKKFDSSHVPTVEQVQDQVEKTLIEEGHARTAKAYILYRAKRTELRKDAVDSRTEGNPERTALLDMFAHKSKLASIIGYDRIEAYKNLLFFVKECQADGRLPTHPQDYLNNNELATNIYQKKYYMKDLSGKFIEKRPEDVFARLAAFMAAVEEPDKQQEWASKFYTALYEGHFLPGGRVIAGGGDLYRLKTMANCFVSLISEDNIESIYQTAYECARTYSYGGGIGVDISVLRPKDSIVHNAADSSTGSVSFMELFSLTTGLIGQSGRRGALMLTIDIKNPDSPLFVSVKKFPNWVTRQIVEQAKWSGKFDAGQLREMERQVRENTQVRFANISLKVTDEFMQAVEEQNVFGDSRILVYSKDKEVSGMGLVQGGAVHYSYGIPSKPIDRYKLIASFENFEDMAKYVENQTGFTVSADDLSNPLKRNMFGDLVVEGSASDLAVKYSGDFMLYYNSKDTGEIKRLVKARKLWNMFVEGNYKTAEPGLIFWSTMTKYSPSNYAGRPIASTNPCGEVPLEDGGACNLASVNLSRFVKAGYTKNAQIDWESIEEATNLVVRFLDNVVTWNEILNPLEKQRKAAYETRRLGVGVMGIADMLNQLGIAYDSEEGLKILEAVSKLVANKAYVASANLAEEKAPSPIFDYVTYSKGAFFQEALNDETKDLVRKKGLRNIAILSIAPTGTISSIVLGYKIGHKNFLGVSGGIEPIFALYYTRRSESFGNQMFKVFHSTVEAYLHHAGLLETALSSKDDDLRKVLPDHFFKTAHHIDPTMRIKVQGIWQKYIDHSISSTVNLPEDIEPETISNIYLDAWKHGLKGITIYREGSRYPILSVESEKSNFQKLKEETFEVEVDGEHKMLHGDDVIALSNGVLTSVYHAIRDGTMSKNDGVYAIAEQEKKELVRPSVVVSSAKSEFKIEGIKLSMCPACSSKTLKVENGCHSCLNEECGFSKCDM